MATGEAGTVVKSDDRLASWIGEQADEAEPAEQDAGEQEAAGEAAEGGEQAEGEAEAAEAQGGGKAEEKKDKEKAEPVSPRMAAILKQEKKLQQDRDALKEERTKFEAERGNVETLTKRVGSDLAKLMSELKINPEQAKQQLLDAWWSLQPEDKRPAGWREKAQARTEMDDVRERAERAEKTAKELEEKLKREADERADNAAKTEWLDFADKGIGDLEGFPLTKAWAKQKPAQYREDIWTIGIQLFKELGDPEKVTPTMLAEAYEAYLEGEIGFMKNLFAGTPKDNDKSGTTGAKVPNKTLSNKKVSSSTSRPPKLSQDEALAQWVREQEAKDRAQ